MFKKLRNRLIIINLAITTIVLVGAFSSIYVVATRAMDRRKPVIEIDGRYSAEVAELIQIQIHNEQEASKRTLFFTLFIIGGMMEGLVALCSYFFAEEAIKPVKKAYEAQKIFVANASHEIKTPLAAIQANLEAADLGDNHWIKNVEFETEKLTALNGELLELARIDLNKKTVVVSDVRIDHIIQKNLERFSPHLKKKGAEAHIVKQKTKISLKANRADFEQVLSILLDNAVKYCEKQVIIEIFHREGEETIIKIKNDGTRLKKKDIEHIFERFYQVDKTSEGVGLGLSIAKSLAERNRWDIRATVEEEMTVFSVRIN